MRHGQGNRRATNRTSKRSNPRSLKPQRREEMPAVQETVEQVRRIDVDQYKYGFETVIESDKAPKGLNEDTVRFISAKKNEPALDARMAARGLSPLADHARAALGARRIRPDRLPGPLLLLGAEEERVGRRSTRSIRKSCAPTRSSAFRCASRKSWPASSARRREGERRGSRSTRCSIRSRSRPPSRRSSRRPA